MKSLVLSSFIVIFVSGLAACIANAQSPPRSAPDQARSIIPYQPKELTLRISQNATIKRPKISHVRVRSALGTEQIARLICHVDDDALIERPSGEYSLVPQAETQPTDAKKMSKVSMKDVQHALTESGIENFKQKWDKPYLFVYDCSEPFLEYTQTIMKSMYPGVVKQLREWELDLERPAVPLVVVIMPDREAFDKLKPVDPSVAAYYNMISNHIILYEDQALADAAPEFGLKQAAYTIVHEGVHQLLANTNVQKRLAEWPMWLSEGVPEYLCPLRVKSKVVKRKTAELPIRDVRWVEAGMLNDLRMYSLLKMRGGSGDLIKNAATSSNLDADGYAVAWGMVHHLATNEPDAFKAYLKEISKTLPLEPLGEERDQQLAAVFKKHFDSDFLTMERKIQKHLTSKKMKKGYKDPIANQTRYLVKMVEKRGKAFLNIAMITTSPAGAREWKEELEQQHPKARFYTIICDSQRKAEYEWRKVMN